MMTVIQLIEKLKGLPPDDPVVIPHWNATNTFENIGVVGSTTLYKQEPRRWADTAGEYMEAKEVAGYPKEYFVAMSCVVLKY